MTLTCTRSVNGTDVAVAIPGGADRTIVGETSATYDDLPTGARCEIEETASTSRDTPRHRESLERRDRRRRGDPVEIVVTNDFHSGDLSLSKRSTAPERRTRRLLLRDGEL